MLILTRRVGETVMIGSDVTVTILGVKGNQVRVGINAPTPPPHTYRLPGFSGARAADASTQPATLLYLFRSA